MPSDPQKQWEELSIKLLEIAKKTLVDHACSEEEAIKAVEEIVKTAEEAFGPQHPHTASAISSLASYYFFGQHNYRKATSLLNRALAIWEAVEPNSRSVANTLERLGDICKAEGHYAQAERRYQEALAITEQLYGPDSSAAGLLLDRLADLFRLQGDYDKAESLRKRAMRIYEKMNPEMTGSYDQEVERSARWAKWEAMGKEKLVKIEAIYGSESLEVANQLYGLADWLLLQHKYHDAERAYKRALAIQERMLGPKHPDLIRVLEKYADLLSTEGRFEDATTLKARAQAIREQH